MSPDAVSAERRCWPCLSPAVSDEAQDPNTSQTRTYSVWTHRINNFACQKQRLPIHRIKQLRPSSPDTAGHRQEQQLRSSDTQLYTTTCSSEPCDMQDQQTRQKQLYRADQQLRSSERASGDTPRINIFAGQSADTQQLRAPDTVGDRQDQQLRVCRQTLFQTLF